MTRPIDLQQNSLRLEPIRRNRTIDQTAASGLSTERDCNGKFPRRASQTSSSVPEFAPSPADEAVGNLENQADGSIDYLA